MMRAIFLLAFLCSVTIPGSNGKDCGYGFKDVVGLGSMITEFQFFNTEGLFYIVRLLFHDLRVDIDLQPPQRPRKGQIEGPVFLEI